MLVEYPLFITSGGVPQGGLTPVWDSLWYLDSGFAVTPANFPAISEIGKGCYRFEWDAETNGDAVGFVDAGPSIPAAERYHKFELVREAGIILGLSSVAMSVTQ